jgi:hypothetical protein
VDLESERLLRLGAESVSALTLRFCDEVENSGRCGADFVLVLELLELVSCEVLRCITPGLDVVRLRRDGCD